ncbi:MAG TPA: hypothetical protein VM096_10435 [Vicinamibacterales bacterium]|nr:hypothetical protein [Vicinamibacterales bacterium]
MPEQSLRQSLRLAALVFVQYSLLAFDIRFVAREQYLGVALANIGIAMNSWYITKGIVQARTNRDKFCFVFGGTAGALVAVWLTRS